MSRLASCLGVLSITLWLGCDRGHRGSRDEVEAEDASTPSGEDADVSETPMAEDAGEEPPRDAASAQGAAGLVDAAPPPERGCGVVRSIALHDFDPVVRVPGGFVHGPTLEGHAGDAKVSWLVVSEDGLRRVEHASASRSGIELALLPLGSDPFTGLALLVSPIGAGVDEHVWAEALPAQGASSQHDLGPAFHRGTIQRAASASLSGTRAVYVTGHVSVDSLHAFVIDTRGERVGDVVPLMDQPSISWRCLQAVPTQRGAAVGFIDQSSAQQELTIFGLSEQAQVQESATLAVDSSSCPLVQVAEDGLLVSLSEPPSSFDLRLLRGTELTQLTTQPPPGEDAPQPLWMHQRGPDDLLFLLRVEGGDTRMARLKGGTWTSVDADLPPLGQVVPAEPGRLFVMSATSLDAEAELYEIGCGDLDT